jgi:hypothetical protein
LGIKGVEGGREGAYVLKYGWWGVMKKIWTKKLNKSSKRNAE